MKDKVLRLLRESESYVSGQSICEQLNVSRTAVWKVVNGLRADGYEIDSVSNRGYKLVSAPEVMSKAEIVSRLETEWLGRNFYYFDEIDSTNEFIKHLPEEETVNGAVCVGDQQTAGKGRLGRTWISPKGSSIYMSYLVTNDVLSPRKAPMITLVAALATADAIKTLTGLEVGIKWPNDIVVNGKKVCGILTEMSGDMDNVKKIVIGIGVNVNMKEFEPDIADKATSLRIELGHKLKRTDLIILMLKSFEKYYQEFISCGDLSSLSSEYNSILVNRDKEVRIIEHDNEWSAVAQCINDTGELIVVDDEGKEHLIISGEVSVRGINGYV